MTESAVHFESVSRKYGRTVALDNFSMTVEPGNVVGLLGSNGAGKTTMLRLAHGILYPDKGRVRVLGLDPARQGQEARTRVSLLSEESSLYPWMTVKQIFDFAAALHPRWDRDLERSFGEQLQLNPRAKIGTFSRGTKAKVALVLAVACRPEVLLLDDPTAGLDPLVRREVLEAMLKSVPQEGGAVLYASHLIHDVEKIADRVVVLDQGTSLLEGSIDELKSKIQRTVAVFDNEPPMGTELPGSIDQQVEGNVLSVVSEGVNGELTSALQGLGARQLEVESLSLEDILVACLRRGGTRGASRV